MDGLTIVTPVYFARFPDGSLYAAGPQCAENLEGGPLAFLDQDHAERVAQAIGGEIFGCPFGAAVTRCRQLNTNLYLRDAQGNTYVAIRTQVQPHADDRLEVVPGNLGARLRAASRSGEGQLARTVARIPLTGGGSHANR